MRNFVCMTELQKHPSQNIIILCCFNMYSVKPLLMRTCNAQYLYRYVSVPSSPYVYIHVAFFPLESTFYIHLCIVPLHITMRSTVADIIPLR